MSPNTELPAEVVAIKEAITCQNTDAVLEKLGKTRLSLETWQALLVHAFEQRSNLPTIKEALLQHPACIPQSALELAIRHNDISIATQALKQGGDPEHITATPGTNDMRTLLTYARRQNKLYPPNASRDQETELDRILREGLDASARKNARERLDKAIGKDIQEAWRDAVRQKQLDIQRAILLLKADEHRSFRLQQEDAVTDKGVAEVMKEIPYFSPQRKSLKNFNCTTMFPDKNKEITCRHLVAHRQAVQERSRQIKFDYAQYASKEKIAAHVSYDTQAKHLYVKTHAAEARLFHNHDFGKTLVQQLAEMTLKKETARLILLESTNHAMSVGLKIKGTVGKPYYVAEFFDPNHTTSHVRVASGSLHAFETLTLKNFIATGSAYKDYYPEPDDLSMMFVRPSPQEGKTMTNPAPGTVENRMLTSGIEDKKISATALFYMLANGFAGDLRRLKNEIASRPEKEWIRLLAAKDHQNVPGLLMALESGHADAIRAFGELLKLVPLEERTELLASRSAKGLPGLFTALRNGHADAVKAFVELLPLVPPENRIELLAAKYARNIPCLFMALQIGHVDTIKTFGVLLECVPPEERVELLAAKDPDGVPGLYTALENGHVDAIKAFGGLLKLVPPEERAGLLAAKRASDGTPALLTALHNGNADVIEAFGELLEQVPSEECAGLLAAKDADGVPGLWEALHNGHVDAVEAFGVLLEWVSPEERAELLAAKDANGMPGLVAALNADELEALERYIEIVAPALSVQECDTLLNDIRTSHAADELESWWGGHPYYETLKEQDPDFYLWFKEMKNAFEP